MRQGKGHAVEAAHPQPVAVPSETFAVLDALRAPLAAALAQVAPATPFYLYAPGPAANISRDGKRLLASLSKALAVIRPVEPSG